LLTLHIPFLCRVLVVKVDAGASAFLLSLFAALLPFPSLLPYFHVLTLDDDLMIFLNMVCILTGKEPGGIPSESTTAFLSHHAW
jgi:hypothetical protein